MARDLLEDTRVTGGLQAAGLLAAQSDRGLCFRPYGEIALVLDEGEGRLTVVFSDGAVAHRPGPLEPCPGLTAGLADGVLANPRHARNRKKEWWFPGRWHFPRLPLASVTPAPPPVPFEITVGELVVEVHRLRSVVPASNDHYFEFTLDDGSHLQIHRNYAAALASDLGIASLSHLEPWTPRHQSMYRLGLRDFPEIVLESSKRNLVEYFGTDEKCCVANLIWEAARHRARGTPLDYGTEYRGFYYRPVLAVLNRLGVMDATARVVDDAWYVDDYDADLLNDPHYRHYGEVIADMVGQARLLTFRDLGFEDLRPDLRTLGAVHPDVVIVAEKASIQREAQQVGTAFGVSTIVLGGMARWEAVEPMADMLRPVLNGRAVRIVTYGDYDPAGWEIDDVFVDMLARYEIAATITGRLVLPKRFSAHELKLIAEPVPTAGSNDAKLDAWMKRTHGVHGEPLRIHADHLRPVERVIEAFHEETGLAPA